MCIHIFDTIKIIEPQQISSHLVYLSYFSVSVLCIRLAFSVALLSSKVLLNMKSYLKLGAKKTLFGKKKNFFKN